MARRRGEWSYGEEVAYRILRRLALSLAALPMPLAARVGRGIGRIAWVAAPARRRIALENLTAVYEERIPPGRKRAIAYRSFVKLFQDAIVLVAAAATNPRRVPPIYRLVNREVLDRAAASRGAIIVSGHLSNFYVLLGIMARLGYKIAVLVRPFANRPAQRVLEDLCARSGLLILDQGKHALALAHHLRGGGITWLALDQNVRNGVVVRFFGRPATTFAGPVRLARRFGVPIIPAFVRQTAACSYELAFKEPILLPRGGKGGAGGGDGGDPGDAELVADLERLMAILEAEILDHPDDWLWGHRRWRHGDRLAGEDAGRHPALGR